MPIGGIKPTTVVNKGSTNAGSSTGPGNGGRTTFRPPWVKADNPDATGKTLTSTTTKTNAPWMRKTDSTKENGQPKNTPAQIVPMPSAPRKEVKLQSREIKVPIVTEKPKPVQVPLKPREKVVKPPTPEESEEEESEEEETETESESEEDESEEETELTKKFKMSKANPRPVVVKRDKSFSSAKKAEDADKAAQEEEERQRRFKLERPKLRHVVVNKEKPLTNKSTDDFGKIRPVLKKIPKIDENKATPDTEPEFKDKVLKKVPPIKRNDSIVNNVPVPPPLPSLIPKPPPPPPLQLSPPNDFEKNPLSDRQKKVLDKLKTRPRKRPDWSEMMKEVEGGRKLKHVECNDRSKPIITCKSMTKVDDKFVYETEKANTHNKLLQQIQSGIRLKPVKTNDRSRPILDGLRKFRRQMTIEEQIHKSESKAVLFEANESPPVESSEDDMDDIDKLRDDLQSTKQLLALELRNREAQERENKRLLSRIANIEAELQREKTKSNSSDTVNQSKGTTTVDEALVNSLKEDAAEARKTTKELERKYQDTAEELDSKKNEVEEQKRQIASLEKKLSQALQGRIPCNNSRQKLSFCYSHEDPFDRQVFYTWDQGGSGLIGNSRRASEAQANKESSPEIELESESEEEEDEEKKAAKAAKRLTREVKLLRLKLTKLKDKQIVAKKERVNLKDTMKKTQLGLKAENKKFKKLEKEVQKMAASMKEEESDEEDENDEEDQEEAEEQEEETEEESESEESEEESGSDSESESESEDEGATDEAKKNNLDPRVKRYENRLSALKKGNYLLQANVDNLQDEINKVKEKANSLQRELDAVIADLGF